MNNSKKNFSQINMNFEKNEEEEEDEEDCTKVLSSLLHQTDTVDALPEKLQYTNFDLLCTLVSIITYLFDLIMDSIVAFYFYHLGVTYGIYHYWYFGLTVTFILLPSLTMTGFSFRWYLMDSDNESMDPVPLWKWLLRLVILIIQFAPILRYLDSMAYGLLSRKAAKAEKKAVTAEQKAEALLQKKKYYTLMVYEDADATLLRLFECFMESAPQLVLQLYILIKDPSANQLNSEIRDVVMKTSILCVSIVSSLVSLAWSLVVYHRSLRYTFPNKKNINFIGSIFQFLWHFSSITARVIALSLFASIYPKWIGPVCGAHWIVMSSWVVFQRTEACRTPCEEFLFSIVLGAIYIFSFFNAKEERTRYKYLAYYSFCFIENTALIVVWFLYANPQHWYYYPGIIGHYLAFFGGILFMILYYTYFHPTGIDTGFLRKLRLKRNTKKTVLTLNERPKDLHLTPLRPSSRCMSSPVLDERPITSRTVRRSASAPSSGDLNCYYLCDTRTFKDMAGGRYRV